MNFHQLWSIHYYHAVVSICLSLYQAMCICRRNVASSVDLSLQYHQHCLSTITCTMQSASVKPLYNSVSIFQGTMISSVHLSRQYYQYCASVNALLQAVCVHQCTVAKVSICHWFNQCVHLYMPFLPAVWTYQSNTSGVHLSMHYYQECAVCTYQCTSAPDVHLLMHYFQQIRVKSSICGFYQFR
jgi:hypothetical protein